MVYPAHFRQASNGSAIEIQTVPEHSRNTAEIAAERLRCVYLTKTGYVAGLLHDCGKCRLAYKSYLEKSWPGGPVQRGAVSTPTPRPVFLEHFHTSDDPYRDMTAELLAFAPPPVPTTGCSTALDETTASALPAVSSGTTAPTRRAMAAYLEQCAWMEEIETLFQQAEQELTPIFDRINQRSSNEEIWFHLGLLARLLLSAVIEGDRYDTARYEHRTMPSTFPEPRNALWLRLLTRVEEKLDKLHHDTPI